MVSVPELDKELTNVLRHWPQGNAERHHRCLPLRFQGRSVRTDCECAQEGRPEDRLETSSSRLLHLGELDL